MLLTKNERTRHTPDTSTATIDGVGQGRGGSCCCVHWQMWTQPNLILPETFSVARGPWPRQWLGEPTVATLKAMGGTLFGSACSDHARRSDGGEDTRRHQAQDCSTHYCLEPPRSPSSRASTSTSASRQESPQGRMGDDEDGGIAGGSTKGKGRERGRDQGGHKRA